MKLFTVLLTLGMLLNAQNLFARKEEKSLKFSGYVQGQLRYSPDTTGLMDTEYQNRYDIGKYQGGSFPDATRSLFEIRRARIKISYKNSLSKAVLQFDAKPTGASIKDAFLSVTEPFVKSVSLKGGYFDRPFGYEISYSSSKRESPERSRLFQTIFAGEKDLGVALEYNPSDDLPAIAQLFNFKGGVFAGNGLNKEYDDIRDFIGRLGVSVPVENSDLSVDAGVSGYTGAVKSLNDTLFTVEDSEWSTTTGNNRKEIARDYLGLDAQLSYGNVPFFGGVTFRGEYIQGRQPAGASSSKSLKKGSPSERPLYVRDFGGYYAMAVLDIAPIRSKLVAKYDVYRPNTEIAGSQKGTADMAYTTTGGGMVYQFDENIRFTAYYDKVENESMNSSPYTEDLNDNVFTFRVQYKF
ncbi:MAG: porin [Chitinispirillaceae bacterium]